MKSLNEQLEELFGRVHNLELFTGIPTEIDAPWTEKQDRMEPPQQTAEECAQEEIDAHVKQKGGKTGKIVVCIRADHAGNVLYFSRVYKGKSIWVKNSDLAKKFASETEAQKQINNKSVRIPKDSVWMPIVKVI